MADPRFWAKLARRAAAAEAAAPARRVADLADEIRRLQAERLRHVSQATGRVYEPELIPYVDELDNDIVDLAGEYDAAAEAARIASTPYLERLTRAYRAPGEPNMALGSPLFNRMYHADRAFEQLRKGRTSNLRNAGGDLARIASQSIRDAEAAAAAGRSAVDRAGGPEGAVMLGVLGGAAAAAPVGMAIDSALEERRRRQASERAAQRAAEAFAAEQAALKDRYLNDIDGFDPVAADVVTPEFDQKLMDDMASNASRGGIRPTSARAVEAHAKKLGLPTFPGTLLTDADHAAGDQFALQEQFLNDIDGFDAVNAPVAVGDDPQVFFTDDSDEQADYASMARGLRAAMDADAAGIGFAPQGPDDAELLDFDPVTMSRVGFDFHTMRPKTYEETLFGPGVQPGAMLPPRRPAPAVAPRRTIRTPSAKPTGAWY